MGTGEWEMPAGRKRAREARCAKKEREGKEAGKRE